MCIRNSLFWSLPARLICACIPAWVLQHGVPWVEDSVTKDLWRACAFKGSSPKVEASTGWILYFLPTIFQCCTSDG